MSKEIKFRSWYKRDFESGVFNKFEIELREGHCFDMLFYDSDGLPFRYGIEQILWILNSG